MAPIRLGKDFYFISCTLLDFRTELLFFLTTMFLYEVFLTTTLSVLLATSLAATSLLSTFISVTAFTFFVTILETIFSTLLTATFLTTALALFLTSLVYNVSFAPLCQGFVGVSWAVWVLVCDDVDLTGVRMFFYF